MVAVSRLQEFQERVATAVPATTQRTPLLGGGAADRATAHFFKLSREIGRDIKRTTRELDELAKVAAKKTLFDDPTVQIQERTGAIKRTINELNTKIKGLQEMQAQQAATHRVSGQANTLSSNVVTTLKTKLAVTGQTLQSVLKSRNKVMLAQKERLEALHAQPVAQPKASSSLFGARRSDSPVSAAPFGARDSGAGVGAVAIDMTGSGQSQALTTVMRSGASHYQDRAAAVENLEGAIEDVAEMFAEFAVVLEQQREMVMRIDENVDAALGNVELGQSELVKYYRSISGNRGLMLKIFAVLLVFVVFFIVFLA